MMSDRTLLEVKGLEAGYGRTSVLRKVDLRWNRLETLPHCLTVLASRGCIVYA